MHALTVVPGQAGSGRLDDLSEPPGQGDLLVDGLALGICGTDHEILSGGHGEAPAGAERLVLGHESLGRVREAPAGGRWQPGDLVVGIVRRPDPVPCACCARGEWDMCRNDRYTERGIRARDGYGATAYRVESDFAVRLAPALERVGVLIEPASIVAKAWEQIERIGARACFEPRIALVTGAGPIGLLAALLGVQRGLDVHVLDLARDGPKPELAAALGATYHTGSVAEACPAPDIVVECTGVAQVVADAMLHTAPGAVVCLTGLSSGGRELGFDMGALNRTLVLENEVVFGSVNANRRHYEAAARSLAAADRGWLEGLITRRVALERWPQALDREEHDVKVVLELGS